MSLTSNFEQVLCAAQSGGEWAWTLVYREYSGAVLRYLKGQGAREPEDLLGEVFVQVVRNIGGFSGTESAFRSWVFMIARNRLVDEWRRAGRERSDVVDPETLVEASGTGNAEAEALERLSTAHVRAVLARLTPDQRDVLLLRILGQLTIDEIAAVLGKRPGAVKALQARGLAAISREISKGAVTL